MALAILDFAERLLRQVVAKLLLTLGACGQGLGLGREGLGLFLELRKHY